MDRSHSDWREMVPHSGFDLHFSDNEWCWASFHVFVSHLYVFFGEIRPLNSKLPVQTNPSINCKLLKVSTWLYVSVTPILSTLSGTVLHVVTVSCKNIRWKGWMDGWEMEMCLQMRYSPGFYLQPWWDDSFYVSTWLGQWLERELAKHDFWGCLREHLWKMWASELVAWEKQMTLSHVGRHHPNHWGAQQNKEVEEGWVLFLHSCVSWVKGLLLSSALLPLRSSDSPVSFQLSAFEMDQYLSWVFSL